jgi:hypothetical protein
MFRIKLDTRFFFAKNNQHMHTVDGDVVMRDFDATIRQSIRT